MYVTMGGFLGLFLIWVIFLPVPPPAVGLTLLLVLVPSALLLTLPHRKGVAIALDILTDPDDDASPPPPPAHGRPES